MKTLSRIAIFILLVILILPMALVGAQEEDRLVVPEDVAGFYVVNAAAGTLVDNGDETYTLTLESVPEHTPAVAESPMMLAWRVGTQNLVNNWADSPDGLEGMAMLEIEDATLWLTLTAPKYDEELNLSFTASITDIFFVEAVKEPEPLEVFDEATLFIRMDYDFETGLQDGAIERGGRDPIVDPDLDWPVRL